jgi:hypothetical protein
MRQDLESFDLGLDIVGFDIDVYPARSIAQGQSSLEFEYDWRLFWQACG